MQADPPVIPAVDTKLLSGAEAARVLSLSERTLFSLRQAGELQFVQVGSAIRYTVAGLEAFIARRIQGGPR